MVFPIQSPIFQPAMREVTLITNELAASVATSFNHDFMNGIIVSFRIPKTFGMIQMNNLVGKVTVTSPVTFTVNINTKLFDKFVIPFATKTWTNTIERWVGNLDLWSKTGEEINRQQAQVIPIAEINSSLANATRNVLPFNREDIKNTWEVSLQNWEVTAVIWATLT